jgi:PAS domain S-box-containing protein
MNGKDSKEKKEALRGYQKNIDFLSNAIEELTDFPVDADIYAYIIKTLKKITPKGTIILVNSFDPDKKIVTLHAFAGAGSHLQEIERILGRPLHGISFPVPDPTLIPMRTGECRELFGGVRELTFGALPEEIYKTIEALPLFGRVYGAGMSWKGTLHGAVTFILPPERELKNLQIVSIFVRQVAGYLQRRQADEDLVCSENLYRTIFENTGTATIIVREDMTIELVNKGFENLSGYVKEDVEGKLSWTEFVVKEDLERMKQYHILRRKGSKFVPEIYEFRYTDRYGDVRNCINHIRMIPGTTKSIASILDVTEFKKTEEALTESEASYIGLFNTFRDSIFILGRDGKFRNANMGAVEMFGYPLEFFIGKTPEILSAPGLNNLAQIHEYLTKANNDKTQLFEFWGRRSSGEIFPMELRLYSGSYFGQEVVIAVGRDITNRKKAENALRESERRFRELTDLLPQTVYEIDTTGRIMFANRFAFGVFGYTREEFDKGLNVAQMIHPDDRDRAQQNIKRIINGENVYGEKYRAQRKDGTIFPVIIYGDRIIKGKQVVGMRGIIVDISDQKKAKEVRQKEEK